MLTVRKKLINLTSAILHTGLSPMEKKKMRFKIDKNKKLNIAFSFIVTVEIERLIFSNRVKNKTCVCYLKKFSKRRKTKKNYITQ